MVSRDAVHEYTLVFVLTERRPGCIEWATSAIQ